MNINIDYLINTMNKIDYIKEKSIDNITQADFDLIRSFLLYCSAEIYYWRHSCYYADGWNIELENSLPEEAKKFLSLEEFNTNIREMSNKELILYYIRFKHAYQDWLENTQPYPDYPRDI